MFVYPGIICLCAAKQVQESMKQFTEFGKIFSNPNNLKEVAEKLSEIATNAKSYTLSETDDWFDGISVKRNLKEV